MNIFSRFFFPVVTALMIGVLLCSFFSQRSPHSEPLRFPYQQAGLTPQQAAAHLLSRFTYGAKPGQVEAVVSEGLEKWFRKQLDANLPDDSLTGLLSGYEALKLSNTEIVSTYPRNAQVVRMAIKDGAIDKDSVNKADKQAYKNQLQTYMEQKGIKPPQELYRQFFNQKILRAAYSNNQLQELLTDFWFNHFNVSMTKNDCASFIPNYERDVIRPNVLGKFEDLLMATAKSPAMLMYLDNFSSFADNSNDKMNGQRRKKMARQLDDSTVQKLNKAKKATGLNENYAREVMELHTLGVDGGYTQQDVTQAARVLTGWTVFPMGTNGAGRKLIEKAGESKLEQQGYVHEGDFMFAANRHDKKEKVVLGRTFAANGGYEEGVTLLKMLAHHPSTAAFISRKLAIRFVSDNPPQSLIDKMAKTFINKDGDIKEVLISMISSPECWNAAALREKTKSPFELAISAVRSLQADIKQPYQLYNWVSKMGQRLYYYQAPTGFPDKGQYWINTGALLNRMNFGLALASQRIPGVKINLLALNNNHEPESAAAALAIYSKLLMPQRDVTATIKRLTPLLADPDLEKKVDEAAGKTPAAREESMMTEPDVLMNGEGMDLKQAKGKPGKKGQTASRYAALATAGGNNSMLAQVVGIIIGSPEFQRK